jgi:hypothetical protein
MRQEKPPSEARLGWHNFTRRGFIQGVSGAGAGLILGSQLGPAVAEEAERSACPAVPRPIPHITNPPGGHFFFPGPVDADPVTSPNTGHDPSLITDFSGVIAQADLNLSGKGTDLKTGASATYDFHCDMRFMRGVFVGLDNEQHHGTIGFV